jgi:hypothetical protein
VLERPTSACRAARHAKTKTAIRIDDCRERGEKGLANIRVDVDYAAFQDLLIGEEFLPPDYVRTDYESASAAERAAARRAWGTGAKRLIDVVTELIISGKLRDLLKL